MNKNELKNGMMVQLRNGAKYFVMRATSVGAVLVSANGTGMNKPFKGYNADMTSKTNKQLDVVMVYDVECASHLMNPDKYKPIWYKDDILCEVEYPNSERTYTFVLPSELANTAIGSKVIVEGRNSTSVVVTLVKKIDSEKEIRKTLNKSQFSLKKVVDTFEHRWVANMMA